MKKNKTNRTDEGTGFERYLERKKNQSKEDEYIEAGVLISELETVDVDKAFRTLTGKIESHSKLRNLWSDFSRIAAILIIPLLIYTVWSQAKDRMKTNQLSFHEVSNPSGVRSKLVLPDGSKVWLNAESTIRYSIPFVRETREVQLVGEAFLDVDKNPKSPMEVKFNNLSVRVLGTQFNVKAFPDDEQLEVVLKEGSILLQSDRNKSSKEQITLKPNQRWVFDKANQTAVLGEVNADEYIAWHQNKLVLNKTSMAELAVKLERWYGIRVEVEDQELYKYKFTTVFDNEPLRRVIELLEMSSPIHFEYIRGKEEGKTGETEKSILKIMNK